MYRAIFVLIGFLGQALRLFQEYPVVGMEIIRGRTLVECVAHVKARKCFRYVSLIVKYVMVPEHNIAQITRVVVATKNSMWTSSGGNNLLGR